MNRAPSFKNLSFRYLFLMPWQTFIILLTFLVNILGPLPWTQAQDFRLPAPGVMVYLSPAFNPPILKGLKVHPDNPFRFDFILDRGDFQESSQDLKDESSKLIKYFLASLTIPEKDLWVNLSPYEKDRIVPESFGRTEMGRDLLAEDYMLKQITASLIYPEGETGKKFWKRIYQEAAKKFGTTNIPVNTFNKVWIVPEKAVVYENAKAGTAYVVESKLKVMLEQDYLSLQEHVGISALPQVKDANQLGSKIVKEIVIPELTKEVNFDKNFTQLRQVYNSLILATWYKKKIKYSILAQVYENKNKVVGVNIDDTQEKQKIYERYLQAFKKGVYNYIKEEMDPSTQQIIPRKYFSGGFNFAMMVDSTMEINDFGKDAAMNVSGAGKSLVVLKVVISALYGLRYRIPVVGPWKVDRILSEINNAVAQKASLDQGLGRLDGMPINIYADRLLKILAPISFPSSRILNQLKKILRFAWKYDHLVDTRALRTIGLEMRIGYADVKLFKEVEILARQCWVKFDPNEAIPALMEYGYPDFDTVGLFQGRFPQAREAIVQAALFGRYRQEEYSVFNRIRALSHLKDRIKAVHLLQKIALAPATDSRDIEEVIQVLGRIKTTEAQGALEAIAASSIGTEHRLRAIKALKDAQKRIQLLVEIAMHEEDQEDVYAAISQLDYMDLPQARIALAHIARNSMDSVTQLQAAIKAQDSKFLIDIVRDRSGRFSKGQKYMAVNDGFAEVSLLTLPIKTPESIDGLRAIAADEDVDIPVRWCAVEYLTNAEIPDAELAGLLEGWAINGLGKEMSAIKKLIDLRREKQSPEALAALRRIAQMDSNERGEPLDKKLRLQSALEWMGTTQDPQAQERVESLLWDSDIEKNIATDPDFGDYRDMFFMSLDKIMDENPQRGLSLILQIIRHPDIQREVKGQLVGYIIGRLIDAKTNGKVSPGNFEAIKSALLDFIFEHYPPLANEDKDYIRRMVIRDRSLEDADRKGVVDFIGRIWTSNPVMAWLMVNFYSSDQRLLQEMLAHPALPLKLRLFALGRYAQRDGPIESYIESMDTGALIEEVEKLSVSDVGDLLASPFIENEMMVDTLGLILWLNKQKMKIFQQMDLNKMKKLIKEIANSRLRRQWKNANSKWEFGSTLMRHSDGPTFLMVQAHELMHNILKMGYDFNPWGIQGNAAHERMADLFLEAVALRRSWNTALFHKITTDTVYDKNYIEGQEEHHIADQQLLHTEGAFAEFAGVEARQKLSDLPLWARAGQRSPFNPEIFLSIMVDHLAGFRSLSDLERQTISIFAGQELGLTSLNGQFTQNQPMDKTHVKIVRKATILDYFRPRSPANAAVNTLGPQNFSHDAAMSGEFRSTKKYGGIDLTSDKALLVQNNGQGIKFHIDPAQLQQLQNAPGFTIGSMTIQPLKSIQDFLVLNQKNVLPSH